MTNADKIRAMKDEELAEVIACPYDTVGSELMPCIFDKAEPDAPDFVSPGRCEKCILEWLQKTPNIDRCLDDIAVNTGTPEDKCHGCFGATNNDCRFCGDDGK